MRTALSFLVLYAYAVAPWLCCCATGKALAAVRTPAQDTPKPTCEHCCEPRPVEDPEPAPKHCPCPIRERLSAGPVDATVEKAESVLTGLHVVDSWIEFKSEVLNSTDLRAAEPNAGPTLRMADRMLYFHHRFLC